MSGYLRRGNPLAPDEPEPEHRYKAAQQTESLGAAPVPAGLRQAQVGVQAQAQAWVRPQGFQEAVQAGEWWCYDPTSKRFQELQVPIDKQGRHYGCQCPLVLGKGQRIVPSVVAQQQACGGDTATFGKQPINVEVNPFTPPPPKVPPPVRQADEAPPLILDAHYGDPAVRVYKPKPCWWCWMLMAGTAYYIWNRERRGK